jgi:putative transposase
MRYSASDKTEIIRLVEQLHLPARRALEKLGIPRSSFYRWYDRYQRGGPEALADRPSRPDRIWNRIPEALRSQIVDVALDQPELSPRELAVRFTDEEKYFVSEASVYRLLKAHDLITSPAYIVISRCLKTLGWSRLRRRSGNVRRTTYAPYYGDGVE